MKKLVSCCGVECSSCEYYPKDCTGCEEMKGKPYWLEYVERDICEIYECCRLKRKCTHCGQCEALPCNHYSDLSDPTRSKEENASILKQQLHNLKFWEH